MKTLIYTYIGIVLFFQTNTCLSNDLKYAQSRTSTATRSIVDIPILNNPLTKGLKDVSVFDIYKDTLYLINVHKGKLIKISLVSGRISTNPKINFLLDAKIKKNEYVGKIIVNKEGFYISLLNKIFLVTRNGKFNEIYNNTFYINDFNVIDKYIITTSKNAIKLIDKRGNVLVTKDFELFDSQFIKSKSGLCYCSSPEDKIYEFRVSGQKIETSEYPPISLTKGINDPYISYSEDKYFLGFSYNDRSQIIVYKKGLKTNDIIKKIRLDNFNLTPSTSILQAEEGNPNLKIAAYNGFYYVLALVKNRLKVISFNI